VPCSQASLHCLQTHSPPEISIYRRRGEAAILNRNAVVANLGVGLRLGRKPLANLGSEGEAAAALRLRIPLPRFAKVAADGNPGPLEASGCG
jgi:hypothetical protein